MKKIMFNDRYGLTQAVIEGRKTMTRRRINPMPKDCATAHKNCWGADWSDKPMSLVVDRDTGGIYCEYCGNGVRLYDGGYHYKAKYKIGEVVAVAQRYQDIFDYSNCVNPYAWEDDDKPSGWTNKMLTKAELMPHQIRITGIKCERLQDISEEDCMKEGILGDVEYDKYEVYGLFGNSDDGFDTPREAFASLIDKVSGRGTWDRNPWVVVYEFELVK